MNTQQLFDTYFENVRIVSSLFFSNSRFALKLYGDAFNSSPLLSRVSDCQLTCALPSCHALFVHRHSVVADERNSSSLVEEDHVLKLLCKNVGSVFNCDSAVCLNTSADTRDLLAADSFGLSDEVLVTDDKDSGQYFIVADSLAGNFPHRIILSYSPVIALSESESSAVVYDYKAVQTTIAIASESWPTAAHPWIDRCHPWICCDLANAVASSPVYFVPKPVSQCCIDTKSQKPVLWKSEFIAAEDVLMKCLRVEIKIAYQLLMQLVVMHRLACCCVSNELLIKHAMFWCLDKMSESADWNEKSVLVYYTNTLTTLHLFLSARHFPHYFMPDVNILCKCDHSVCDISWMDVSVTDSTALCLKAELIQQLLTCTKSDFTCSIARHLKSLFGYSISMSFIQLCHYLHADGSVDCLITRHCDMLSHINSSSVAYHQTFVKPLVAWINSSLGNMYAVKAYTASSSKCWAEYVEKAKHCLLEAVAENEMLSCTLYLVQFLLLMRCHKEAVSYIDEILASTDFTQCSATRSHNTVANNCTSSTSSFSDQLLAVWHHANRHMDIMFSPIEVSVLFPRLQSSLFYAYFNKLGYNDSPVAVVKLQFWTQYIGALCYMHSDVAKALKLLADAERCLITAIQSTDDDSDRAHIAYFNILAGIRNTYYYP